MHRTLLSRFIIKARRIHVPPVNGYEVSELPNESLFDAYMRQHSDALVVAVLHSGPLVVPTPPDRRPGQSLLTAGRVPTGTVVAERDPGARALVAGINLVNLGHPDCVRIAMLPGPQCPTIAAVFGVLTYPTTLLFHRGEYVDRVVGARYYELSTKCLFTLRNSGRQAFAMTE